MSGEGESRTRKAEAQLLSGQVPSPIGLPLQGGRYTVRTCAGEPGHPFPAGHFTSRSTFHARRAGDSNAKPKNALVSSEAGQPWPVHSPYRPRDSNPHILRSERSDSYLIGLERHELRAADRLRTGDLQLGKVAL